MTSFPTPWRTGVNGSRARPWFVFRNANERADSMQIAETSAGQYRRFAGQGAAQRLADQLNANGNPTP